METKKFYTSKTLWVNVFSIIAIIAQSKFGWVMPVEYQASFLACVNLVLRSVTSSGIEI